MPNDRHSLLGILDAIDAIEQYTISFNSADEFYSTRVNFDAALMNFIVIGEMVDRIAESFKVAHAEVDWKQIKGLRNLIAHDYFGVDAEELWDIVKNHLPRFKTSVLSVLNSLPSN